MTAKSSPGHWMHPNAQYMVNLDRNHFINPKKNPDMYNRIWLILSNQLYLIQKLCEHKIPPVTFLLHRKSKNVGSWTTKDELVLSRVDIMLDYIIEYWDPATYFGQ